MITPADKAFHDAVRRADVGWLTGHLDARLCPPAVFGLLVRHDDSRVRYLGLVLLTERVTSDRTGDGTETAELARLLPVTVQGPPEEALVLARLHERLGPYRQGLRKPSWRTVDLPVRVQIAWLRAEVLNEPTAIRTERPGELLYQAVQGMTVTRAHRPDQLVNELAGSGDPVLQAAALRLARQGLHAGLLAPARVRACAVGLLGVDSTAVVAAAVAELAEPWAGLDPLPAARLSPLLAADSVLTRPEVAEAAIAAAAHHGHRDLLRQVIDDPDLPPGLRRRGMELLGDLADRGDIGALTTIAAGDPLLFGVPAVACLRGLHRRGHFPDEPHVPSIVRLALADHSIAPHEIATILFTCRQVMFRALVDTDADDPSWPRRLALLVALAEQGAQELPIGDTITRLLPSTPLPGPFLDAIRALRHADAEDAVIALLPSQPAAALDALEAIGGDRTTTALSEGLGLATAESAGVIAPHLRAVRNHALEVLWHLTHDPSRRRAILVRLDPADLPTRIAADLGGPDEQELALLSSHLDPNQPVAALCRLAAHGGAGTLPVIADLLLRIVAELAASWEPGGSSPRGEGGRPGGEPVVPQEILDAVHDLGRRLHERGRIRPSCLLDAATAREAGDVLVATMGLDLLDRPGLSSGERAILLELLLRAPYARTRMRVHRLLRDRDRHVRKHVIALLARDATGDDAQALSATLIALTGAEDIRTVRQALLALGHARARWASTAIAACLDHPNMNIKKTAAEVLVRVGTPTTVPALLFWLGRHDNPGLRGSLVEALRAILGEAYPATVLAAAEHSEDGRTRELLLVGLDRTLPARSVLALDDQSSRVAPTLLALVAAGRVGLASGTIDQLTTAMHAHGITPPAAPGPAADIAADLDVRSLTAQGWNPSVALRVAERHQQTHPAQLRVLRPMLADWLRLAGSEPAARTRVLRLVLRLCPAPWTTEELTAFARCTGVLLDGLAEASDGDRHDLVAVLEAVAPTLPAALKPAVVDEVRALPPGPGNRFVPTLLRALDAVLVRADLEQALASAGRGADPWQAETAVLREAFAAPQPPAPPSPAEAEAWRAALDAAVRTPSALERFRRIRAPHEGVPGSRDRLGALIDVYACAGPEVRPALIDWMTDLQPLDAPPWTIAETTQAQAQAPRSVHIADLDQPRSTALRERLLAMVRASAAEHRHTAARALLEWPEPEARLPVLRAFLRGRIDVPVGVDLARTLNAIGETELRADGILRDRVALVAGRLDPRDLEPLVPLLLEWWEHEPPPAGSAAGRALGRVPVDVVAEHLGERLDAGAWGFLDLLRGRPLLRTPALTRIRRRLRAEGRDDLADSLLLVEGPLRRPDAARQDAATLARLRDPAPAMPTQASRRPSRQELLDQARTGDLVRIRRALARLVEGHRGPDPDRDPRLRDLIDELLRHPKPKVRLHAHRTSRAMLDRQTYLHHTSILLDDPRPDLVRTAIRTLCHANWAPALPALTGMLEHSHPVVRRTAAKGLIDMGEQAIPTLTHAADHARPDRRSRYTAVLEQITAAEAE
ncbi:HEAT repeat domain-containing protein [Streptomyces virginiae]|uniref:HEAT repeat domain-containing protein n=1 Tax=Streptomyces virginiae TaxID=1961 RepID=UPI00225BAF1C|nr:HEAT repeat domain-containing protein [Streptomyces virginiae]MCX4957175.1 HEAT repeat domain-containing protein [Streptomyces virginiae]